MEERLSQPVRVLVLARPPFELDDLEQNVDGAFVAHLTRDAETLREAIDEYNPSVVLVDTEFPDGTGIDAIAQVRLHAPHVGVLALAPHPPAHDQVALATRAGACGFIDVDSTPSEFREAIQAVNEGERWFPAAQTETVLRAMADDLDTTAAERRSRLTGMILALVPLTGLIAAVQTSFWRRYMGKIGVRPVDLAVDPASRVVDAIVAMLFVIGFLGPLLLVGNWLDLLRDSRLNRGVLAKFLGLRKTAHVVVSALWLVTAWILAQGVDLGLVLIVGPAVGLAILAKVLDANSDIPKLIRIEGVRPGVAVAGSLLALLAFVGVLGYEVFLVGPDLRTDGEHGYLSPRFLGVNAQPVEVFNIDTEELREYLYLGGNADLYVLVDPCDDDRVDMVPVGSHHLSVIDEVTCPESD